jgi:hypothetical protein
MENSIEDKIEEKYTRYINCETDILELTIEEAIFILEKDASFHYVEDLLQEAYKVILSDYKRVLEEANRYKNMYKAEHEIHLVRNEQLDRKENAITRCKELENENKTIKEANDYWRSKYCEIANNNIPIQKVKDIIRRNEEIIDISNDGDLIHELLQKNKVYEELLESEE